MEFDINILTVLGLSVFLGLIISKIFVKFKLPQVVGFIFTGVLLGKSGLHVVDGSIIDALSPLSSFALGIIGFMVGSELEISVFKKYGKQFMYILLFECITTFILVSVILGFSLTFILGDSSTAWAVALMLGAIASASAPAGTTDVLWENKTKGPLTRTILGIVALDDGLGLMLFVLASSFASSLVGASSSSFGHMILHTIFEIGASLLFGVALGFVLMKLNKIMDGSDKKLVVSIGMLLLCLGVSSILELDMLLVAMTMGATAVNISEKESKPLFSLINSFFPPINIMFFVLIGGSLDISELTYISVIVVGIYTIARTSGKALGSFLGATIGKSPFTVKKFLPYSLLSQAGVAVGLSILAGKKFDGEVGTIIVATITASTLIIQLIGPIGVKYAVTKAKEVGLNVLPEDVLLKHKVRDVVRPDYVAINETDNLKKIMETFGAHDSFYFPVLNFAGELEGIVTIDSLKETFADKDDFEMFLIASDLLEYDFHSVSIDEKLFDADKIMHDNDASFVVVNDNDGKFVNIMDNREIKSFIQRQTIALTIRAERLDQISCV